MRAHRDPGARPAAREALRALAADGETPATLLAYLFTVGGDLDGGLAWADSAVQRREPILLHMLLNPTMKPLRSHPRFRERVAAPMHLEWLAQSPSR